MPKRSHESFGWFLLPLKLEIFKVMCEVAAQNPDPGDNDSEGEEDMYCNQEEILAGSGGDARAAMLDHFDSMLQIQPGAQINELLAQDPDRFEDPDDVPDPDGLDGRRAPDGLDADGNAPHSHHHPQQ